MIADALEDFGEEGFGTNAVEFRGADQAVDRSGALSARLAAGNYQTAFTLRLRGNDDGRERILTDRP